MTDTDLIRIRLQIHYNGHPFHGWQVQPGLPTVQGAIEDVIERISGAHRAVIASGRTDAGVHALGQVATVTLTRRWTPARLRTALNALLPHEIWIESADEVDFDFHPRYDAVRRTYLYRVGTIEQSRSPFMRPYCWALGEPLDPEVLNEVAAELPGRHSFRAFAKAGQPERGEHCTVHEAAWSPWTDGGVSIGVQFTITADRYLHHMVRYLTGTHVAIGRGIRPASDLAALLRDPDFERPTSPPAPPEGLYLARVEYGPREAPSDSEPDDHEDLS